MKKTLIALSVVAVTLLSSCTETNKKNMEANPFKGTYNTPFETPAFDNITIKSYMPAFKEAMKEHLAEVDVVVNNSEAPTFKNTVEALEYSGNQLKKVSSVFFNLTSAETSDELNALESELSPKLSAHYDDISLNEKLFLRIKSVYDNKENLNLDAMQMRLLDKKYQGFVRNGALLKGAEKDKMRAINTKLSALTLKFGQNVLNETNKFKMFVSNSAKLSGLSKSFIAAAAVKAKENGKDGEWLFTIDKSTLITFIKNADNRELREKLFKGYIEKGNNNDELDNKKILEEIANLRVDKSKLLGFATWADYILDVNMAKKPENVNKLLNEIMVAALPKAKAEAAELQKMIDKEGGKFNLEAWDWWYYSNKLKNEKYAVNDDEMKPYFELDNVRQGAFDVATKLFGITFTQRNDIQTYHEDVDVWEVKEANGEHIGILYTDYFSRAGKRGGAWMEAYRKQYINADGKAVTPIITNVCNFTKPPKGEPALISTGGVETIFHEFGHALHGLLSNGKYPSLTGTATARDFVELPSQLMENWAFEPEVLNMYAKHYKTGEVIPQELVKKMQAASKFNQGFATVEYTSAAMLDMDWHTLKETNDVESNKFEELSMLKMNMISEIIVRYRSTYFNHIFSNGYSAGYYSYMWSEILDADAFEAFTEKGIFHPETAKKLRDNIYSTGGSKDEMELYKAFRGKEPSTNGLKKRKGLM
ncbi:MAG: M3 family metallopeptidase [Ichthyobacteriaceae bacterium]|nr:M3 family metallopeptidase [Ichthyobacteriaceae bacterium]